MLSRYIIFSSFFRRKKESLKNKPLSEPAKDIDQNIIDTPPEPTNTQDKDNTDPDIKSTRELPKC